MHIDVLYDKHRFDAGKHWVVRVVDDSGDVQHFTRHFTKRAADDEKDRLQKEAEHNKTDR